MFHLRIKFNLLMQFGWDGNQSAVLAFSCVHILLEFPLSSKPVSQEYAAESPMLKPVTSTLPNAGSDSARHSAEEMQTCSNTIIMCILLKIYA